MQKFVLSILGTILFFEFLSVVPIFAQGYIPSQIMSASISKNPNIIVNAIINTTFIIIGLIFFIVLVIAGIQWIISGSSEDKKGSAQKKLINAVIGIVIIASSYLIIEIIAGLLGVNFTAQKIFTNSNCGNSSTICLNSSF